VLSQFPPPLFQGVQSLPHPGFLRVGINQLKVFARRHRVGIGKRANLRPGKVCAEDPLRRRSQASHFLGSRLAKSHTMAQPMAGESPRSALALDGVEVAFDLLPSQEAVQSIAKLVRVYAPSSAGRDAQNHRTAGGVMFLRGEFCRRSCQRQMQTLAQDLCNPIPCDCLNPRGVAVRPAIGVMNRNQIRLCTVGPDVARGFCGSAAASGEVWVGQFAVIFEYLAAGGESSRIDTVRETCLVRLRQPKYLAMRERAKVKSTSTVPPLPSQCPGPGQYRHRLARRRGSKHRSLSTKDTRDV
jgi:hypothetical protein